MVPKVPADAAIDGVSRIIVSHFSDTMPSGRKL